MNATKLCSIDGCENAGQLRRKMCDKHYRRWLNHGDPLKLLNFKTPEESFAARTEKRGDCLLWTGSKNLQGYGRIRVDGSMSTTHRYAWQRANGPIPEGKIVDHICHNRACVNLEHLRLATFQQNSANRSGPEARNIESGLRNVYKHKYGWLVSMKRAGEHYYFGIYKDIEEAAEVAAQARLEVFGEYAGRG